MTKADAAFQTWLDNIGEEISYWKNYLSTGGGDYPDDFVFRLKTDTPISARDERLHRRIAIHPSTHLRLLDVGSGPLTNLGKVVGGKTIEIVPSDPLADVYNLLMQDEGVKAPISPTFADAENLSQYFPAGHFDGVHCANALDHSYDPLTSIFEMLKVVAVDGFIHLGHFENEAVYEDYRGLHQWNFTERGGDFVIWNKSEEHSLASIFRGAVTMDVERIPANPKDWIILTLRRNEGTAEFLRTTDTTIGQKYRQSLLRHFLNAMPASDSKVRSFG